MVAIEPLKRLVSLIRKTTLCHPPPVGPPKGVQLSEGSLVGERYTPTKTSMDVMATRKTMKSTSRDRKWCVGGGSQGRGFAVHGASMFERCGELKANMPQQTRPENHMKTTRRNGHIHMTYGHLAPGKWRMGRSTTSINTSQCIPVTTI